MNIRNFFWLIVSFSLLSAGCIETSTSPNPTDPEPEDPPTSSEVEITNIDPEEGYPGTIVTITGSGFSSDSDLIVEFGGLEAEVETVSKTKVEVTVPEGAETGPVQITIDGETTSGPTFTILKSDEPEPDPTLEPYNVEGRVTDAQTDIGVKGAAISFSNGMESIYTDGNGKWVAEGLEGPVAVTVEAEGNDFPIHTRLVLGPANDVDFKAHIRYEAPRGSRIAYQYREDCTGGTSCDKPYSIWTMNTNGLYKEKLTNDEGSDRNPTWSPDAEKIAFDSNRKEDEPHIWIMNTDGSDPANTGVKGTQPAWSPDGERMVYVYKKSIRIMELDGGNTELFRVEGEFDYLSSPTWSPEGSKIAFDFTQGKAGDEQIWVMEADGSNLTQLTDEHEPNRSPAWHPSGDRILYSSNGPASLSRLRIMNVDGSDIRSGDWPDHSQIQPVWSPNGEKIAYVHRRMIPVSNRIHSVPADNNAWMPIAPERNKKGEFWAESPAWAPKEL